MKALAAIGLAFFLYCLLQVVSKWQYRNAIEKTIWFIIIAVGGGWCVAVLLPQSASTTPQATESQPQGVPSRSQYLSRSVENFLFGIDALAKADDRPTGITADSNVRRVANIFLEAIDSARFISRQELNELHPALGDRFLDDGIRHMRLIVEIAKTGNQSVYPQAVASIVAWRRWWNPNQHTVMSTITERYSR